MGKGVTRQKAFIVKISICGKQYTVGHFDDEQEANQAYQAYEMLRNRIHAIGYKQVDAFVKKIKEEGYSVNTDFLFTPEFTTPQQRSFAPKARKRPRPNDDVVNVVSVDSPVSVASTQPVVQTVSQDGMEGIPTGGICEDEVMENPLYTIDTYTTSAPTPPPPPLSVNKIIPPHIPAVSVPLPARSTTVKAPDPVNRPVDAIVVKGRQNTFEFNGRTYDLRDCEMSPSPTGEEDTYYVYDDRDDPVCYVRIVA